MNLLKLILKEVAQINHSISNEVTTKKVSYTTIEP